jgi:hypothetical protein
MKPFIDEKTGVWKWNNAEYRKVERDKPIIDKETGLWKWKKNAKDLEAEAEAERIKRARSQMDPEMQRKMEKYTKFITSMKSD